MIALLVREHKSNGRLVIRKHDGSEFNNDVKRINREKTLDGGVIINDSGYCHGDRTIRIKAGLTPEETEILKNIFWDETMINIALDDGFYSGHMESLQSDGGEINLTIFLKERLG